MGKTGIVAGVTFLLSQLSKFYVVEYLDLKNKFAIDVLPPFLNFRMGWNRGINFGLFSGEQWVLIAIATVISGAILWYARYFKGWFAALFLGSIIGGALSNSLDRILYGAVADFLNMSCCGIDNPFAFNVADIFVALGALGLIIFSEKLKNRA
ncbi:MAG: signal peptidase II [Rhodobacterales bacterium]